MKNAHERFGWLEFEKQLKDTRTRLRVGLDRFISEPAEDKEASGTCHLVSVFGSDVDIGAIWAGLAGQEWVTVSGPDLIQRIAAHQAIDIRANRRVAHKQLM